MKNRSFLTIFAFTAVVFLSLAANTSFAALQITDGVERSLAQNRHAEISDVRYNLKYNIPPLKDSPVTLDASISFDYNGTGSDVVFDFEGSVGHALVNGQSWTPKVENEHIVVPSSLLHKGENTVMFSNCKVLDKALNRRSDHLYTLFVPANARSAFPCFDQPNIKANFNLTLNLPEKWTALSAGSLLSENISSGIKTLKFDTSDPLPTYLFSFTAGQLQRADTIIDGRPMEFYYMETDPQKTAQIPEIFRLSEHALKWMEDYTGIEYPFKKVALVALPGYQFGGMEHPGAIQYKDKTIFLPPTPTPAEIQRRAEVISHETAHMWFGDLVTMEWFNDVWTKEVFANLMASKATADMFPDRDNDLTFLRSIQTKALATDVTPGTHAIEQELDNLNTAGLLYGNIIYQKAPVMMRKLEEIMGSERFREGLSEYLKTFSYGNATWDDLITILDRHAPDAGLPEFSKVWVKEAGLPNIICSMDNGNMRVEQSDPMGRDLIWKQSFSVGVLMDNDSIMQIPVQLFSATFSAPLPSGAVALIPNINGDGYGRFILQDSQLKAIQAAWPSLSPLSRQAALMVIYDEALRGQIEYTELAEMLMDRLEEETDAQILATLCAQLTTAILRIDPAKLGSIEQRARRIADSTPSASVHLALTRALSKYGQHTDYTDVWTNQTDSLLNTDDYTKMAYHLAILNPEKADYILAEQRKRLEEKNPALVEEFDYVSRGARPGEAAANEAFQSLLDPSNRTTEPWATALLSLLADETRGEYTLEYIAPGLSALEDVRRHGAIFFPANWAACLLAQYRSAEAGARLREWIDSNPDYRPALMRKVKESGAHLLTK